MSCDCLCLYFFFLCFDSYISKDQGCETWIRPYGSTGLTENRSSKRVFNSQELAYTRKAVNCVNRGQTSQV